MIDQKFFGKALNPAETLQVTPLSNEQLVYMVCHYVAQMYQRWGITERPLWLHIVGQMAIGLHNELESRRRL